MKSTIFDLVEDEPTGTIFDFVGNEKNSEDEGYFQKLKDYAKTFVKGGTEGLQRLGQIMGPIEEMPKIKDEKLIFPKSKEEQREQLTEKLEEYLPTEEDFGQKVIRRGLKEAPTILAFPGSSIKEAPRMAAAALFGQTAEEMGAPEIVQSAAELTAFMGPSLAKKILSSGKDAELIKFAKEMGMTDAEITPLLQSEFKQKWLSKIAFKKGETQKALQGTKEALGNVYQTIQDSPEAAKEISELANGKLINGIQKFINELPSATKNVIKEDLDLLLENKITGKSLMTFWKKLNQTMKGDNKTLGILKEPVKEAISSISPELQKDFSLVNKLYSKYYPISSRLKPSLATEIMSQAETFATMGAVGAALTGNPFFLKAIIGELAAKKIAQQMLINPRLQQLSKKAIEAMNSNKPAIAKKVFDEYARQISKTSPEFAKELQALTLEELEELTIQKKNTQNNED